MEKGLKKQCFDCKFLEIWELYAIKMRAGYFDSGFVCWMFLYYFHERNFSNVDYVGCYNYIYIFFSILVEFCSLAQTFSKNYNQCINRVDKTLENTMFKRLVNFNTLHLIF